MIKNEFEKGAGHWILARMGKRVLRPGGKELTKKMITALGINNNDNIVEFAPGLGYTASLTLAKNPKTYVGVDADEDAVKLLNKKFENQENAKFILGNAANTKLENETKDKVYGEAMLTMHPNQRKSEIIKEAHRILKKGGLYGIHELGLTPNSISEADKDAIEKDLVKSIKVTARPLTENEWKSLLEKEGFEILEVNTNPMHLLEKKRILDDEGFFRTIKIVFNILTHPEARKRILQMRKVFRKYEDKMNAISIVAKKI